jgi:hypothetical protein
MKGIRHLAVIIGAVAWFMIGALWYSVFSAPWLQGISKTMEQMEKESGGPTQPMLTGFIAILVMCYVLAWMIGRLNERTLFGGAKTGATVAIGFVAAMLALNYGFEVRGIMLWLINAGYALVGMVVAGAVIGAWPGKSA